MKIGQCKFLGFKIFCRHIKFTILTVLCLLSIKMQITLVHSKKLGKKTGKNEGEKISLIRRDPLQVGLPDSCLTQM